MMHVNRFFTAVLGSMIVAGNAGAAPQAQGRVELARGGQTAWNTFLPESADPVEQFACRELTRYFDQICGARLGKAARPDQPFTIQIGLRSALRTAAGLPAARPGYDGYAVRVSRDSVVIAGDNSRGVVYGVYDLLEQLGCRWCYPTQDPDDPECVPKDDTPAIETRTWAVASPLQYRRRRCTVTA